MASDWVTALHGQNAAPSGGDWISALHGHTAATPARTTPPRQKPKVLKSVNSAGPLAALGPIVTGARDAAGAGLGKVFDIIGRPGMAMEHFYASPDAAHPDWGGTLNTFLHSESQQQQNADRAAIRKQVGVADSYQRAPHWLQGVADTAIDTIVDPTTLIGGSGILENAGRHIAPRVLPTVLKAGRGIEGAVVRGAQRAGVRPQAQEALHNTGDLAGALYDLAGPHNRVGRQAASAYDVAGHDIAQTAVMARNASKATRNQITNAFMDHFNEAIRGLSPAEEKAVYKALHYDQIAALPANLQSRAKALSDLTDSMAHLAGTEGLQKQLAAHGFQLPEKFAAFAAPDARRIMKASSYRKGYLPSPHDPHAEWLDEEERVLGGQLAKRAATRKAKYADSFDPFNLERSDNLPTNALEDPDLIRNVFQNRIKASARSIAGRDANTMLTRNLQTMGKDAAARVDALPKGAVPDRALEKVAQLAKPKPRISRRSSKTTWRQNLRTPPTATRSCAWPTLPFGNGGYSEARAFCTTLSAYAEYLVARCVCMTPAYR